MTALDSKKFKFTPAKLNAIPAHDKYSKATNNELSDTETVGLKLLVGKTGGKRFLLRYISPVTRKKTSIALGRWPDVDLLTVRAKARKLKVQIADGIDPKIERDTKFANQMPTLYEFFYDTFLEMKKSAGKKTWRDDEARFKHCKTLHSLPIDQISGVHLQQLQNKMLNGNYKRGHTRKQYAPASSDRVISLMKSILKQAYKLLDIRYIGDKISLVNPDNRRMEYLDVEQTAALIRASREYYCRVKGNFIALLFLMGCRDKELRTRKWDEVDLVNGQMFVPETKNGTPMIVYLSPFIIELFRELLALKKRGNPYVFPGRKEGCHISQPRNAFKLIKERAGIKDPDAVCFHVSRHSFATNLLDQNVDLLTVQRLLNHKDISSTQRYIKHSEQKLRSGANVLSSMVEQQGVALGYSADNEQQIT